MSSYPFKQPNYFKISNEFNTSKNLKCKGPNNFFEKCLSEEKNVVYGSERPIKEKCTIITGHPASQCNSLWNNMTKRKTLVEY
mgnify:FL=1